MVPAATDTFVGTFRVTLVKKIGLYASSPDALCSCRSNAGEEQTAAWAAPPPNPSSKRATPSDRLLDGASQAKALAFGVTRTLGFGRKEVQ